MAYYIERPLKSKETEEFLKSKGYVLVPHISKSMWTGHEIPLHLSEDAIILNDDMLIRAIYEMGYEDGREEGRMDAVLAVQRMIYATVYPMGQIKNVEKEPTHV